MIRKSLPAALLLAAIPCFAAPLHQHHTKNTHPTLHHTTTRSHRATVVHHATPVSMSPDRATQIQTALIKAGYLKGEPTGVWDSGSTAAMQKLQGDNGWQTKLTPDSRALIKLGLGPQSDAAATETAVN